jgi:uncharacterized membrane protein YhaH (DUF805 family)
MDAHDMHDPDSWQFLYRTDKGVIDAPAWWRGALLLFGLFVLFTLGFLYVRPYAVHDLATSPLLSVSVLGANLYIVFYAFVLMFLGICYYNLSAKRWRSIGRPPSLAGLLPFLGLVSAALHWLEARVGAAMPVTTLIVADVLLVLTFFWNIIELGGFLPAPPRHD